MMLKLRIYRELYRMAENRCILYSWTNIFPWFFGQSWGCVLYKCVYYIRFFYGSCVYYML